MKKKTLVAYFSASGVTRAIASQLAGSLGADLFDIRPEIPYTDADLNWNDRTSRSSLEMRDPASRPKFMKSEIDLSRYENVLIGFPIWWYVAPTIINSFMDAFDFSGKTVRLFATSGGSGIESCEKSLRKQYPSVNWAAGMLLNSSASLHAFTVAVAEE